MSKRSLVALGTLIISLGVSVHAYANMCRRFLATPEGVHSEALGSVVPWSQIIPGQTHFGRHILKTQDNKNSLKVIETSQSLILNKNIPVIEIKTQTLTRYMMVDNHHSLLRFVTHFSQEKSKDLLVPIVVVETITTQQFDHQLMRRLLNKGYAWTPEPLTPLWRFSTHWPQNILQLHDFPMRSAVQLFFDQIGLSGKSFRPFIQFYLAEELLQRGFKLKPKDFKNLKREERLKERMRDFLLSTPEILEALKQNILEEDKRGALGKLTTYQTTRPKH